MLNLEFYTDDLNKEYYSFYVEDYNKIWLDNYYIMSRKSKRHKWNIDKAYSRLEKRNWKYIWIEEKDVPLHDGIIRALIDKMIPEIQVKKWSER